MIRAICSHAAPGQLTMGAYVKAAVCLLAASVAILVLLALWRAHLRYTGAFFLGDLILSVHPGTYAALGLATGLSLSVLGAGWGIFITGASLVGAAVRVPRVRTKNLISILFCEAVAIYSIISAFVMFQGIEDAEESHRVAFGYFWGGITIGATNLACALSVGMIGSAAVLADAANAAMFMKMLVVEIFASAVGLFGLIVGLVQIR